MDLVKTIFFDDDPENGPLIPNSQIQLIHDSPDGRNKPLGRSPLLHLVHAFRDEVNLRNQFYLDEGINHMSGWWAILHSFVDETTMPIS